MPRYAPPFPGQTKGLRWLSYALLSLAGGLLQAADPSFSRNATVHDPALVRDGASYYVFGSHLASASTTDLMNWTQISTSAAVGNALVPNPQTEFAETLAWAQTNTFWAPDVIRLPDGRYYYYYCACKGDSPRSALGLAVADSITGPYKNVGILLKSGMWNLPSPDGKIYDNAIHPNTVDPMVFFDKNGQFWMVYGSYSGGIFILRMNPASGLPLPDQAYGKKLIGGNNSTIEGACIVYSPDTDFYYLMMTFGGLDAVGGYNVRMGRSRNPDGPYLDPAGRDLTTVAGAPGTFFDNASIAPHGAKLMGNYQFAHIAGEPMATTTGYVSPGGVQPYRDPETGAQLLSLHTRFVGRGEAHEVRIHPYYTTEDGWLVVGPRRHAQEALAKADPAVIPGSYKLINHGKAISSAVNSSTLVTLASDGTITGSSTGTWALSAEHFATLVIDGKTYRGVFCQQWDDDNRVWTQCFTALSGEGISVWGSKVAATSSNTAPAFTSQPTSLSLAEGQSATFEVNATGTPAPVYQWRKNGVDIPGATARSYTISRLRLADAGAYTAVIANSVTAFQSGVARLSVAPAPGPAITTQPGSRSVAAGSGAVLSVQAEGAGLTYQWRKYTPSGTPQALAGATDPTLALDNLSSADESLYDCVVTRDAASSYSETAKITVLPTNTPNPGARLSNLSSRTIVSKDDKAQIAGFVISGTGSKQLLVRGSGPALAQWLTGTVPDPWMDLFNQSNTSSPVTSNDDWNTDTAEGLRIKDAADSLGAFSWTAGSKDTALLVSLPAAAYSAKVQPRTTDGVGLIEVYDADNQGPRLTNISTRSLVGTEGRAQIAGFVISGTGLKTVLIRASGPALAQWLSGTVQDPLLKLYNQSDTNNPIALNDDWESDSARAVLIKAAADKAGAFGWSSGGKDAALLVSLQPGIYSAVASTKGAEGIGLIEVYEINP